jgi:hypothetical protein
MAGLYNDLVDLIPDKVITAFLGADDLDEPTLSSSSVELTVEYLLLGAKVEAAFRHCTDDLASYDLTFNVCIGTIYCTCVKQILNRGADQNCDGLT